jgi:hypothetical protein
MDKDQIYQRINELNEITESLAERADGLHCPDWCSGTGECEKCQTEAELTEYMCDLRELRQQLKSQRGREE